MSKKFVRALLLGSFVCVLLFVLGCDYLKPMAFKPDPVSNVAAKVDSSNKVVLTWNNPEVEAEGAKPKGYKITRSYDGTNFFEVGTAKPNASTYTDTPPEGWSIVGYSVYGFNGEGNAQPSGSNWAFARPPSGWSTINTLDSQLLDDISRGKIAMAVDSSNALHAVYLGLDKGQNAVFYRKKAGNSTAFGPAMRVNPAGTATSFSDVAIAVDQKGNPHICYDTEYIYSSDGGSTWPAKTTTFVTTTAISGNNNVSAMAIDSNSKIHIIAGFNLQYFTNASGNWVSSPIEKKPDAMVVMGTSSIAIDSNNKVHAVYTYSQNGPATVKYVTNASGAWVSEKVIEFNMTNGLPYATIALDKSNKPHVAYYSGSLNYINKVSGSWASPTVIDNTSYGRFGNVGLFSSIAIDKSNKVHIAYRESFGPSLKYATNSSGSWVKSALMSCSVKAPSPTFWGGGPCPIKIDSSEKIHIAFVDAGTSTNVAYKYISR